ncbi:MAG: PAS domain S-box protein, partial [Blastocatellia bacterium]
MLRESEESYRNLISQMKDYAIFSFDQRGVITTWNEGCEKVLGFDRDEFIGLDIRTLFTPEDVASGLADKKLETVAEQGSASEDRLMIRKGGERFWASGVTTSLRDSAGKLMGFTKVMRDVTERKQAEREREELLRALETERLRLEQILQQIPAGVSIIEAPSGKRLFANEEAKRLLGHQIDTGEDYTGYARLSALRPDGSHYLPEEYPTVRALLKGEIIKNEEMIYQRSHGELVTLSFNATPLRDAGGRIFAASSVFTDITERKRVEALLRESEERLRAERDFSEKTIDSLPGAFYLFDQQGKFMRWNKNLEKVSGYSTDEIALMRPLEFIVEEDRAAVGRKIEEVFASGEANIEARLLTKAGRGIPYLFMGIRIVIGDRLCLIGNGVDISARKRAEEEREQLLAREREARAEAEVANQLKDEFLATISHELRTPLNAILGWARLLRDPKTREEQMARAIEIIERNSLAQARLIDDLLDASRIVSGKLRLDVRV